MSDSLLSMHGKLVLVTGASSGLGAHFAHVLANAGAKLVVAARRIDKLDNLVAELKSQGHVAIAVSMDVTDTDSVNRALDNCEAELGPVEVLVNNAGVADSKRFVNVDEDSWDYVIETNLKGAWRVAHAVSKRILARGGAGSIVNIASILGLRVSVGESTYATAKAGLVQMTKAMALELGHKGIRVNALCPGYFRTEINAGYFETERGQAFINNTPARRLGRLDELNAPLLMMASDAGSFINGVALPVDGGHMVSSL
jgi:NAD(P)-dependent dehydrogenase (short-subunit alcohol dehydrogenase family)